MDDVVPDLPPNTSPFIVGVGASAGGLDALEKFFSSMPADTGMVFVVIQHLSPDYESMMDELLSRYTEMDILTPTSTTKVKRNTVYLIPNGKNLTLRSGSLHLVEQEGGSKPNHPIDLFFESIAEDAKDRSIGVVLSGTGSDGSRGLIKIQQAGGLVIVQDPTSADFDGMPNSAIGTNLTDVIATPEAMAEWITRYALHPKSFPRGEASSASDSLVFSQDPHTAKIFRLFRHRYGIDFSFYRATTISRRLERRVSIAGCRSLAEYLEVLEENDTEVDALYRDLLVEVTSFFRDEEAFARIQELATEIVASTSHNSEIRIWTPGCATGEEAYSLAMIFDDCATKLGSRAKIKVFATDVHPTSLETASSGVYSSESFAKISEEFRSKYFQNVGKLYHISREIRKNVVFAQHDITRDPPFTRLDLISCRNVLIYLEPVVQRRVLSLFHFGLKVGGTLFLGPSETIGKLDSEFDTLDRNWKIFRKLRDVRLAQSGTLTLKSPIARTINHRPSFVSTATRSERHWVVPEAHEHLLQRYVPASVLVNKHHEVEHSFGDARHLLIQPPGKTTMDVTKLVSRELATALVAGLHKARTSDQPLKFRGIPADSDSGQKRLDVTVERFEKSREEMFLITFEECDEKEFSPKIAPPADEIIDPSEISVEQIALLERELAYTKETLQATVEELETSNEELQSTNEELVASNEELQSTNEELQSVNEELHTVNSEHQQKISELTSLTTDINNLLTCSRVGTIFLDNARNIKKFTPAAKEVFHLIEQDVGRPLEHIASRFGKIDVNELVSRCIETNSSIELQVNDLDGQPYLLNCFPYAEGDQEPGIVVQSVSLAALRQDGKD